MASTSVLGTLQFRAMSMQNPFNFRAPTPSRQQLVGRKDALVALEGIFRETANGRSSHAMIDAPVRRGKTSLLNAASELADETGLLPVRLDISPALFDSDLRFFEALFDSVVRALAPHCRLQGDIARLIAVTATSESADGDDYPVVTLPAFATPEMTHLSSPLLAGDFERAVTLARLIGKAGIALLLDRGEHLDHASHVVLDAIDSALEESAHWTMIIAGEAGLGQLFHEHSYSLYQRFNKISLPPLSMADAVSLVSEADVEFAVATAHDLWQVCGPGEPYWIKVGASLLWKNRSQNKGFVLTPTLIKWLVEEQCTANPEAQHYQDVLERITSIDASNDGMVHSASRLASYEEMTVTEYVLAQRSEEIAQGQASAVPLDKAIEATEGTMAELVRQGLLEKVEDRFHVAGEKPVHVYLRYESARRKGEGTRSAVGHSSYGTAAAPSWLQRLAHDLDGVFAGPLEILATHLDASSKSDAPDNLAAPFKKLQEAVDAGNPVQIATAGLDPIAIVFMSDSYDVAESNRLAYVGIVFSVGIDEEFSLESERVACGWIRQASDTTDTVSLSASAQEWLQVHADELAEYRLKAVEVIAGVIDRQITDKAIALMAPFTVQSTVVDLYRADKLPLAVDYLSEVAQAFEAGRRAPERPWAYKVAIVDAYSKLGFLTALLGRRDDARSALRRAIELVPANGPIGRQEESLIHYNSAYVRALNHEYAAAAERTEDASNIASQGSQSGGFVFLLLNLPAPKAWGSPSTTWSTAKIPSEQLVGTMEMQARSYEALSGKYDRDEFLKAVAPLSARSAGAARICAWTLLTRFDDAESAVREFESAQELGEPDEVEVIEMELKFARRLVANE